VSLTIVLASAETFLPPGGLQNEGLSILVVSVLAIAVYIFWQIFVTGRTEWTLNNNEIKILWTKKFFLSKTEDFNIKWNEIESISRGFEPHYYNLRIKVSSGDTIRFYHDILTTRDDFENLIIVLNQTLNKKKNYHQSAS
jgi:hypothetical protein